MRLTALELPHRFGQPKEQLALARELLAGAPTDLVLLPEASLTGYVSSRLEFDLAPYAEAADGSTARALADLAREHRTNLFGPLIERDGEHVYNTCIGFDRAGREIVRYRKRHPWYPETWATPGPDPHPLVVVEGVRVTIAICFDIHFVGGSAKGGTPQTKIAGALPNADVLLFPSAWVEDDPVADALAKDTRATLLPEVARSSHLTIVNANWGAGDFPRMAGQGRSRIVRPLGEETRGGHRIDWELEGGALERDPSA